MGWRHAESYPTLLLCSIPPPILITNSPGEGATDGGSTRTGEDRGELDNPTTTARGGNVFGIPTYTVTYAMEQSIPIIVRGADD